MKKALFILLVFSLFLTSCSLIELEADSEPIEEYSEPIEEYSESSEAVCEPTEGYNKPIIFLEKHNLSKWERTDRWDPDKKFYMRILKNPNKIAEIWSSSDTNKYCYVKDLYSELCTLSVIGDTENRLKIDGSRKGGYHTEYNLTISNDTLIEYKDFGLPPDAYIQINTWVKSKEIIDDLNLCD